MTLLPEERELRFSGLTSPIAAYRVHSSRVIGAWIVIGFLFVMSLVFVGFCLYFLSNPNQINKPFLAAAFGVFIVGWLALDVWILRRLAVYRNQRVLLYPEGFVAWRDGSPRAYLWEQIRAVECKRKLITQGILERWAYVGKDVEYIIQIEGERPLIINAMILEIEELGEWIDRQYKMRSGKEK
jgi:hypothetical protein